MDLRTQTISKQQAITYLKQGLPMVWLHGGYNPRAIIRVNNIDYRLRYPTFISVKKELKFTITKDNYHNTVYTLIG